MKEKGRKTEPLLLELLTEELPPLILERLGRDFAALLGAGLKAERFLEDADSGQAFATPRRLAVLFPEVLARQVDEQKIKKGPAVSRALQNNEPTPALLGFLRAAGKTLADLKTMADGKQEIFYYAYEEKGVALDARLTEIWRAALKKLPIPKEMRWGAGKDTFVRPVHGVVALLGERVVDAQLFGLHTGRTTLGHRVMAKSPLTIPDATAYVSVLNAGYVIADFATRREKIARQLKKAAEKPGLVLAPDAKLLAEVTGLVEWPVVLTAEFAPEFLAVPPECLILTMKKNQKYFPLLTQEGALTHQFLVVANLVSKAPREVVLGNERVLKARLADAQFFYDEDKKIPLIARVKKLKQVVYQHKIGSQYERVTRLTQLSAALSRRLNADETMARRAASLAKADLVTEMVGEFPELQGIMGKYYARHDGESEEVARAIEEHYWPRFADDHLPTSVTGAVVALADKAETLVGIWGIDLKPTGDKDPYGLRRAALGIIRILLTYPLDLKELLQDAFLTFKKGLLAPDTVAEVFEFILTRLEVYLARSYASDAVDALLAGKPTVFAPLDAQLTALVAFKELPEAAYLAATNKRVANILKKADHQAGAVAPAKLEADEEKALWQALEKVIPLINAAMDAANYTEALQILVTLKPAVDDFFTAVMVMSDDMELRENRLNLLALLEGQLNTLADISRIQA